MAFLGESVKFICWMLSTRLGSIFCSCKTLVVATIPSFSVHTTFPGHFWDTPEALPFLETLSRTLPGTLQARKTPVAGRRDRSTQIRTQLRFKSIHHSKQSKAYNHVIWSCKRSANVRYVQWCTDKPEASLFGCIVALGYIEGASEEAKMREKKNNEHGQWKECRCRISGVWNWCSGSSLLNSNPFKDALATPSVMCLLALCMTLGSVFTYHRCPTYQLRVLGTVTPKPCPLKSRKNPGFTAFPSVPSDTTLLWK